MGKPSLKLHKHKTSNLSNLYKEAGTTTEEEILALNAPQKTDSIRRKLGVNTDVTVTRKKLDSVFTINRHEDLFKGHDAYLGSHIKKLCTTYALHIRNLDDLRGYIPEAALIEVQEFANKFEDKVLVMDSKFYILAGEEYFRSSGKGKKVNNFIIFYNYSKNTSSDSYYRSVKARTCLIQVSSSGEDFSEKRRWNMILHNTADANLTSIPIILVMLAVTIFMPMLPIGSAFLIGIGTFALYLCQYSNEIIKRWED